MNAQRALLLVGGLVLVTMLLSAYRRRSNAFAAVYEPLTSRELDPINVDDTLVAEPKFKF